MNTRKLRKNKSKRHQVLLAQKGNRKGKKRIRISFSSLPPKALSKKLPSSWQGTGRGVRIVDPNSNREFAQVILLEYTRVFPSKTITLINEIKNFSREMLIGTVLVLGRNYGNCYIADMRAKPFFSYRSEATEERMRHVTGYISKNHFQPDKVSYASEKTFLEFLKLTFGIKSSEEKTVYPDYISEVKVFDLLLAINEQKVTPYAPSESKPDDFARMVYVSLYATNEFTNLNENLAIAEQIYYAKTFFDFITSREEYLEFYMYFLELFKIESWQDYFRTMTMLGAMCISRNLGTISLSKNDPDGLLNKEVLNRISIGKDDYIETDDTIGDENRDFAVFRSKPIIRMGDEEYLLYSKQLIIDRFYNSIYFDLLPAKIKYKDKKYEQFYKEIFVEKYLFDHTMLTCIDSSRVSKCFPLLEDVIKLDFVDQKEKPGQPDFYIREANAAFIFECKAIKLNGDLKSRANIDEIMEELSNKLLLKKWQGKCNTGTLLAKPKPEGIGQLVNHITDLEAHSFKWDDIVPDELQYYPILVLESSEIAQIPLTSIVNEWYDELIEVRKIRRERCNPVIVMTIKTLFLYDYLFKKNGFKFYIEEFIKNNKCFKEDGTSFMSPFHSFDTWMNDNEESDKKEFLMGVMTEIKKSIE